MKKSIAAITLLLTLNASAIELLSYKNTNTNVSKISEAALSTVWESGTPACIKDGSKLLGVNKAFKAKNLGYRDCSSSDKAREKQRMLGYKVVKINFTELPDTVAKTLIK